MVSYIPPMSVMKQRLSLITVSGKVYVNNTYEEFIDLVKLLLRGVDVDEAWYLSTYPDVGEAVKEGIFKSAKHHFVEVGYFEGRRAGDIHVDNDYYLKTYPDIAEAIAAGTIVSAKEHFEANGYNEGRMPSEY